jgi:hypothetical protein
LQRSYVIGTKHKTRTEKHNYIRLNAEKEFGDIFERVKSLAEKIDIAINMPRISKRRSRNT